MARHQHRASRGVRVSRLTRRLGAAAGATAAAVVVNATGTNLLADFGVAFDGTAVLPQGLSTAVKVNGTPVTGPIKVTNGATYTVVVTLTFDAATAGKVSQNTAVDLGGIDLTLTQVRPLP